MTSQPRFMLDTNALAELIHNPRGALAQRLEALEPDAVCTSIVAACALRSKARLGGFAPLNQRAEQLLQVLAVLPLDQPADQHYADIRAALDVNDPPFSEHDLFIAAHARSCGRTLMTRDMEHFRRVPGLAVNDWSVEQR